MTPAAAQVMPLSALDWAVVALYLAASVAVGLWFSRRGSGGLAEYFVAGREVTWWLAGVSMVATTFAADTPLVVAKIVRTSGLQGNWFWWSSVMGGTLCVYFFARLWRRARIITDAEFMELRYDGRAAAFLRGYYAFFRAIVCNAIVMGWVILAMYKIVFVLLGWPKAASVWGLVAVSIVYIFFSGLWGVLATDFFQFILAMAGCIVLAGLVLWDAGGPAALLEKAAAAAAAAAGHARSPVVAPDQLANIFPNFQSSDLAVLTFFTFIFMQWWQSGQGDGFLAQRLFSCKDERHSVLAVLFYSFLHYAVRPWPWIIVGLGSLVYFPDLADPETAYPLMMIKFLPAGLRGMLVAGFLAAFMSTIVTHINLGASYLVSDVYKRFLVRDAPDRHYLWASRLAILMMTALAGLACLLMKSVYSAWLLASALMAGPAVIVLLRWYWWRINAAGELAALLSALAMAVGLSASGALGGEERYALRLLAMVGVCTACSLAATFLTPPEPAGRLDAFFRRVRPGGWWGPVAARCPEVRRLAVGAADFLSWGLTVASVYLAMFGLGWLALGSYTAGAAGLAASLGLVCVILRRIADMDWGS